MTIPPLSPIPIPPTIASLPKADLHLHQENVSRMERVVARRQGCPPYDRLTWARHVLGSTPPGMGRLDAIYEPDATLDLNGASDANLEDFIARIVDVLEEAAADGAILAEVRFGAGLSHPDFMSLFREAERRVQDCFPHFCAEAIGWVNPVSDPARHLQAEQQLQACLAAAQQGLAGVDFRVDPYDTEADPATWEVAYRLAERAADAGLGITMHAGEFSTANLAAALRTPGLTRIGHGVHAAYDPALLDQLARSGVTLELSLSCNVILGAVPSYEAHPIRKFVEYDIPITLNTDLPVHACTTIGREYAIASLLGFSPDALIQFTRNALNASFTTPERRATFLELQNIEFEM